LMGIKINQWSLNLKWKKQNNENNRW
jgi:hypothetical protein